MGVVDIDVGSIVSGAGKLLKDIRTAWTGKDPELDMKLAELQTQIDNAQNSVNAVEAASTDKFVSRWRPAVAWICVFAMGWYYILTPLIYFFSGLFGYTPDLPVFDSGELMSLIMGMLGLGTLRTFEKYKGVST